MGDNNNRFFFNSCRGRWNCNKLLALEDEQGQLRTTHREISEIAVDYLKSTLGTSNSILPIDEEVPLPCISETQKLSLLLPFSPEEIQSTMKDFYSKNKRPGPDGFTPEFYLAAWDIVGCDVTSAILHFFDSLNMPHMVNAVGIALIPKVDGATRMPQFRPISYCNIVYKCISKLLNARLKPIMSTIISHNQSAFVPKRCIGDNIMLAQSICRDYHRDKGVPRCAIKLDIQKAFDTLNWNFLFEAMARMNFPTIFIEWVKKCVTSAMLSVKINGALEGFFESKKGLRQGDPLSPYMFVIAMEVLTSYLKHDLSSNDNFSYHWHTKELQLSHLIFVDDLFLFRKGN